MNNLYSTYGYLISLLRILFPKRFVITILYSLLLLTIIVIILFLALQITYYLNYKFKKENPHDYPTITDKRVSIVIPIKSEPIEIVEEAVKHILMQNYPKQLIELIIISDDPQIEAKALKRRLVRLLERADIKFIFINRLIPVGGKAGALNEALKHITGEYILFLDADAYINEDYVKEMVSFMETSGHAAAVSDINVKNTFENDLCETQAISWNFLKKTLFIGRQRAGFSIPFIGTCSAIKTDVIREIGGWDNEIIIDDLPLTMRLLSRGYKIGFAENAKGFIEAPKTYKALKTQQKRWAYGGLKTAIKYFKDLVSSKIPLRLKLDILLYLIQYQITMINLIFIVIGIFSLILCMDLLSLPPILSAVWNVVLIFYVACYLDSIREENYSLLRAMINLGRASALLISLIPTFIISSARAILGKNVAWEVTPKGKKAFYNRGLALLESIIGQVLLLGFFYSMYTHLYFTGLAFLIFSIPFIYTGFKTFLSKW